MKTPEPRHSMTTQRSRVLLCATCYPDAEAAMTMATELARQIGADLHGVLVRDNKAFLTTEGVVSAVVYYSGAQATGVRTEDMARAFRADARRFRDQLLRKARDATIWADFQETEGRISEAMKAASESGDVVVFGIKPILRRGNDLVVVLEEGDDLPEFVERLANRMGKHLTILSVQAEQNELLSQLDRMSPAAVILARESAELPSIARIAEVARCPVIVSRLAKA